MSSIRIQANSNYQIFVNNGTARTFTFGSDGTFTTPNTISILIGGFKGTLTHANTADRSYTLPDRAGTVALQDATSIAAMLPTQTGMDGRFLQTNAGVLSWATSAVSAITSLNGNTAAAQTLTYSASGTGPAWSTPDGNTVQLAIPLAATAGVTGGGLVTKAQYDNFAKLDATAGTQTFANAPLITTPSTNSSAVATYGQVQAAKMGLSLRGTVRAWDNSNTTRPTANPVIDGQTIALNDRVLFTALSVGGDNNRVWKATGSLSAVTWTLETDGPAGDGSPTDGDLIYVQTGTARGDNQVAFNGSIWDIFSGPGRYSFSTGLSVSGKTISVDFAPSGTSNTTQAVRADDSRLSDSRTPTSHVLDSASHTISGKTAGQILVATAATSFGFVTVSGDATLSGAGALTLNTVSIGKGGTGQTTASAAFNALSPVTLLGDLIVGSGANANSRLAGNITTTKMFLNQTGSGSASNLPTWSALLASDIPGLDAAKITSGILATTLGGTGLTATSPKFTNSPVRLPVRAVATTNITISAPGATIDSYSCSSGDRILLTAQGTGSQNGIWVWNGSAAALTRPEDYSTGSTIAAYLDLMIRVTHGTVYAGSDWRCTTAGAITIDTTTTAFAQLTTNISSGGIAGILPIANGGTGLATTSQNYVFAGPTSGSGAPSWRTLVAGDIPALVLDSAAHTISGKTAGQVLIATAATTFGFVTFGGDISSISAAGSVVIGSIGGKPVGDLGLALTTATLADNTAAATLVTGCSWAVATYRAVKLMYQISRGAGNYSVGWITLLYDGTNARITVGEDDSIGTVLSPLPSPVTGIVFTADVNGGNMRLLYQTNSTGTAATMYYSRYPFPL